MTYGTTRFINFAFGDFFTVGAFAGILGTVAVNSFVGGVISAIVITGLLATVIARIIFKPMRDRSPLSLLIVSLGVGICIRYFIAMARGTKPISIPAQFGGGISLGTTMLGYDQIATVIISGLYFASVYYLVNYTRWGAKIRSVSSNRTFARITGMDVEKTISIVWFLGAGAAGLGGVLYCLMTSVTPMIGWHWMVMAFTATLVGGIGSLKGAAIGAFVIGIGSQLAAYYWTPGYQMAFVFVVLIAMLLFKPQGIAKGMIREEI